MNSSRNSSLVDLVALAWPPEKWKDTNVVLAVSGGADSVAMLSAIHQLALREPGRGELIVAHVNHGQRGSRSDHDARCVEQLAGEFGLRFELRELSPDESSSTGRVSEDRMRKLRYESLASVARQSGSRWLCTAHHANDQAETVLFRILRGTGVDGLSGIPQTRVIEGGITLCRPLLKISRQAIRSWLEQRGHAWTEDESNSDVELVRNRIRHETMDSLQKVVARDVVQSLAELAESSSELRQATARMATAVVNDYVRFNPAGFEVDRQSGHVDPWLWGQAMRLAWEQTGWPCQDMTRKKWARLRNSVVVLQAGETVASFELPGRVRVSESGDRLVLRRFE